MLSVRKLENFRNLGFYLELDVNKFHLALSIWALTLVFFWLLYPIISKVTISVR